MVNIIALIVFVSTGFALGWSFRGAKADAMYLRQEAWWAQHTTGEPEPSIRPQALMSVDGIRTLRPANWLDHTHN